MPTPNWPPLWSMQTLMEDTPDGKYPWSVEELMQVQQRLWTEWLEAGQIWVSWWVSTLPTNAWPPVGMVAPPTICAPNSTAATRTNRKAQRNQP